MSDIEGLAVHRHTIERLIGLLDAIRSVAEIAWRRAEQSFQPLTVYRTHLQSVFPPALDALTQEQRDLIVHGGENERPIGVLFVSSERGLCGPFNDRLVTQGLQRLHPLAEQAHAIRFLCLGSRGKRLLEAAGHRLLYVKPLPSLAIPSYVDIEGVALDLLEFVERGAFGRLVVVHNAPVHRFQYGVMFRDLLPPALVTQQRRPSKRGAVKPARDAPTLVTHLLTEYLLVELYQAVIESAISEQLARMYTMRLATENANKLLEKLTLEYNLARSQAVTQELLEIVAGYDATDKKRRVV